MNDKESLKVRTFRSAKWNTLERFGVQGIQFIITIFIARFLSPADYGLIGILSIFINLSQTFIDSGFSSALVRTQDPREEDYSTVFYFNTGVSIFIYLLLYAIAPFISTFFHQDLLTYVLRIYSVTLIINALVAVQVTRLQINLDFKSIAISRLVASIISGLLGLILAILEFGVWALVFQNVIFTIISCVCIQFNSKWHPNTGFSIASFRKLGAFGSRLLTASVLDVIYKNLTKFAIAKFYTPSDLGNYERGSQFADLPNKSINGVLGTVTFPILSKIQNDDERLIYAYRRYIQMSSMVIFFVAAILFSLARPIVLITLTGKWSGAIIFLQLFVLSSMFDHLSAINLNLLKVKGRSDLFLKLEIIKKTISLILLLISIPYGVLTICVSSIVYNQIAIICNTYYTGKLFSYGYLSQIKDFLPYILKSFISFLPAFILSNMVENNLYLYSISALTFGVIIYVLLIRRDINFRDMYGLFCENILKRKI